MSVRSTLRVLRTHRRLPGIELGHALLRERSAPLEAIAARVPREGRILDVGCGHGVLEALLEPLPARTVLGIDPDGRKIACAAAAFRGRDDLRFEAITAETLRARERARFEAIVICDVLYLVAPSRWSAVLEACRALLVPRGLVLLKEAEADRSWRHLKTVAQELVMVSVLRRTAGAARSTFVTRAQMRSTLDQAGFTVLEIVGLGEGYTTPHVLYVARGP